jgi:hypothetical protein
MYRLGKDHIVTENVWSILVRGEETSLSRSKERRRKGEVAQEPAMVVKESLVRQDGIKAIGVTQAGSWHG